MSVPAAEGHCRSLPDSDNGCQHILTNCHRFSDVCENVPDWMLLQANHHHASTCHTSTETGDHPSEGESNFYPINSVKTLKAVTAK